MTRLKASSEALARSYDLALLDLDGVVYLLDEVIPQAPVAVSALPGHDCEPVFVTNSASRTPETVAEAMRSMGVPATTSDVVTSAQVVASAIVEHCGADANVLVVGSEALSEAVSSAGLTITAEPGRAQAVAFGATPNLTWQSLADATVAVRAGAWWATANRDMTLPTPDGPLPGLGTLVDAVTTALGRGPDLAAGKPEQPIYLSAMARKPGGSAIMVGDRPDSDIEGANRAGIDSLLVFTGVASPHGAMSLPPEQRPTFLGWSLAALTEPHAAPVLDRTAWTAECGGWIASVAEGELLLSGSGEELDAWRALCEISWAATDAGRLDRSVRLVGSGPAARKLLDGPDSLGNAAGVAERLRPRVVLAGPIRL